MASKTEKKPFNVAFGKALRGYRTLYGYDRAEDFAPEVERVAGIKFTLDTLRRIESGRQAATVEQYAAICLTLTDSLMGMPLLGQAAKGSQGKMQAVYEAGIEREAERIKSLLEKRQASDGWEAF